MLVSSILLAAAAAAPFHDCIVSNEGVTGVHVDCRRAWLQVADSASAVADLDAVLEGYVTTIRAGGKHIMEKPAKVKAGGKIRARSVAVEGGEHWLLAAAARPEGMRLLACHETEGEEELRCDELVAGAAQWKWHEGPGAEVPRSTYEPTLAGRKYEPPNSCAVTAARGGASVACPDGSSFGWFELDPDSEWDAAKRVAFFPQLQLREGEVACDVEGVASHCRQAWDKDGSGRLLVSDAVNVRGARVAVLCYQRGRELAEACRSSLTLP
jgi:hypothetical protein